MTSHLAQNHSLGPGGAVCIRQACREDVQAMVDLLEGLFSLEQEFTPDRDRQLRGLMLLLERPEERLILVAQKEGTLAGMGTLQVLVSTAEGGRVGLVEDIIVDEAYRGKGIGTRILQALEHWAASKGLSRLQLLADRDNASAHTFYYRRGWSPTQLVCLRKAGEIEGNSIWNQ